MKPVSIKIFNESESISISKHALIEYCRLIGFKRREANKLGVLFEELVKLLIKNNFIKGQDGEVIIQLKKLNQGIEIQINDHGIPIDKEKLNQNNDNYNYELANILNILDSEMDEVEIGAKGYKGNEVILRKIPNWKKTTRIIDHHDDPLQSDSNAYESKIKLLDASLAGDISKLAYMAYHYSYPYEEIYIPERVKEKIQEKLMLSAGIFDDETGKLVSHSALSLRKSSDKTPELGTAFTDPNYRGYGYINSIWSYLINKIAKEEELFGVFAMAVCSHPYSQKACHKMGMIDTALLVSRAPVLEFESINISNNQRESIMIALKIINQPEKVVFYPPQHHKKMILEIAEQLNLKVKVGNHPFLKMESSHNFSNIEIITDSAFSIAKIYVLHVGKNIQQQFVKEFHKLKSERYESIYLYLDLTDYHTEKITKFFESIGFFFAGLMHEENRMNMVLQYLNNQIYDFCLLKVGSEFGKKLIKYVEKEYKKISDLDF